MDLEAQMYAIGGLAVGEPKEKMLNTVEFLNGIIPKEKPRVKKIAMERMQILIDNAISNANLDMTINKNTK